MLLRLAFRPSEVTEKQMTDSLTPTELVDQAADRVHPRPLVRLDGFDECVLGLAWTHDALVYSYPELIKAMMRQNGWCYDDAVEWFHFNIIGGLPEAGRPIFVEALDDSAWADIDLSDSETE